MAAPLEGIMSAADEPAPSEIEAFVHHVDSMVWRHSSQSQSIDKYW